MVWTTDWWEQYIALAHSSDLIHWTEEHLYIWADYTGPGTEESDGTSWPGSSLTTPAPKVSDVENSWAPEITYDERTGEYLIYWSTSISSSSVFPATWNARSDHRNHRIYFITTRDFETYTPRRFFFAPQDRVIIDAFVCNIGDGTYRLIVKDESDAGYGNLHICASQKPLDSWENMPEGFWSHMSAQPFAGSNVAPDFTKAEGPGGIRIGDEWYIYADYWMNNKTRAWSADDFLNIVVNDNFHFPFQQRHGTVFKVPVAEVDSLLGL